jgi:hypothetical protein
VTVRQLPLSCSDTRHRSSAAAVGASSAKLVAVQTGSDTRVAPKPLPRPHYVVAIVADVVTSVTNGSQAIEQVRCIRRRPEHAR